MSIIKDSFQESDSALGAFICELGVFREICRLEARSLVRTGQVVYICLITINNLQEKVTDKRVATKVMEKLMQAIKSSLRSNDLFSRYSLSQYIVMLAGATFENCNMVMDRVLKNFYKSTRRLNLYASYKIQTLDPKL